MQKEISELYNLIKIRNIDKAYSEAKRLYDFDDSNLDVIKILVFLHIQKSQFDSAIKVLEKYYNKNPDKKDFDYYANMGISLKSNEEYGQSLAMYDKAKEINPESPLCFTVPAEINLKLRKFQTSINLINKAIEKIEASKEQNILHFANAIKLKTEINVGLNNDAENGVMLKAILNEKFHPDIFYLIATVNPSLIDGKLLTSAEDQLKTNNETFKNKLDRFWHVHPIYFGLAIYYQKIDQKKSEQYFHLGNKETMQSLRYNSFDYQKSIGNITTCYEEHFSKINTSNDSTGNNNFFILGTPRSGTTLIESFISSNKEVTSAGELTSANRLIEKFINKPDGTNLDDFVSDFRKTYLERTNFLKGDFKYVVDKLPENFLFIGYLFKLLPGTKIIRTFRNPWDVAVSLYKQRYVTNIPYSASFFNIGVFMANFEAINRFWSRGLVSESNMLDIKYEELVEDPEKFQKKIYEFLKLESDFSEEKRRSFFSQTASIRQVGSAVHKNSIKKEEFLDRKEEFFEALLMQRKYWEKRGFSSSSPDFFGYDLT